jgi:hypothetical protein
MAYVDHIQNLYKEQSILLFKECYALEKVHGTNAFIRWNSTTGLQFGSGGTKHETFVKLFDQEGLKSKFLASGFPLDKTVSIFGESYGGKEQGMSATYGPVGKFIVFDVQVGDCWLDVPKAEKVATDFGLEFVPYAKVSTDTKELDAQRDADSIVAIRNGMGSGHIREGVVLRPLIELTTNNGSRLICKHKRDEFRENKSPRLVIDPDKLKVLSDAKSIADEWVVSRRLEHVLDKIPKLDGKYDMSQTPMVIKLMIEDVLREGSTEIVDSKEARSAIGKKTVELFKGYLQSLLKA